LMAAKQLSPNNAQRVIDGLDKVRGLILTLPLESSKFHLGSRHCRDSQQAYRLTAAVRKGKTKLGHGGFGDVWKGRYDGRPVAVKVLRVSGSSDLGEIEKVRFSFQWPPNKRQ
jgi:hypothetical protein